MSLVKVRRAAEITLPTEVRDALRVGEGDYLEAELVEGGVMLRPVPGEGRRKEAWEQVRSAIGSVLPSPEQATKPLDEQEAEILAAVDQARREYGDERRRP